MIPKGIINLQEILIPDPDWNITLAAFGGSGFIPGPYREKFCSSPRKFSEISYAYKLL